MKRAFTLFELIFVLAIMAILAQIGGVFLNHYREDVYAKNIVEYVKICESALRMYWADNQGVFPSDLIADQPFDEITALKSYLPDNFKYKNFVKTNLCNGIVLLYDNASLGIKISLNSGRLTDAVYKQLKNNCLDDQLDITTESENVKYTITYVLKQDTTVYF